MSALRSGVLALALAVIAPIAARAADIPLIRVFPPACAEAPVSVDDFIDSLRVELAGRQPHCCVVGPGGDPANDAVKVTLSIDPCDPATQQVGVLVDLAVPQRSVQRLVSLEDLPAEARARALALAVAELIRAAAEPEPTAPAAPAPASARDERRLVLNGSVAGELRHHFSQDTTLWGPRLGLSIARAHLQATLDAGAASSTTDVSQGDVNILLASAALFVGPRFAVGPMIATVGPTGALGWARIRGQSNDAAVGAGTGSGLVAMAGARAAVEGPASLIVRLFAYVDGGLTIRKLDADAYGAPVAGISGAYLVIAAGVRFGPS